eukprot:scaffold4847_cov89-Cylindrotheca_fusiformis.AAC.1
MSRLIRRKYPWLLLTLSAAFIKQQSCICINRMMKSGLLESFLLFSGGDRHLQQIPDYTSPPLPIALDATPKLYRSDEVIQEARDLDAAGNCTVTGGNRCQIPFPVAEPSPVGVIFYCGALVDPRGYSPLASILNQRYGLPVVIPIFASDVAFAFGTCDTGRLDMAKAEFPEVEKWILAGHSLGGTAAMADMWSRWNEMDESAAGLVLFASDVIQGLGCGDTDFAGTELPMAHVRGSNDRILNRTRSVLNEAYDSNATFKEDIYGANHGSFGAYNDSARFEVLGQVDGELLIPSEVVWDIEAATIANVAARTGVSLTFPDPTWTSESSSMDDSDSKDDEDTSESSEESSESSSSSSSEPSEESRTLPDDKDAAGPNEDSSSERTVLAVTVGVLSSVIALGVLF